MTITPAPGTDAMELNASMSLMVIVIRKTGYMESRGRV